MARRHRRHSEYIDEGEESGELNLVPYLDIITTLVIFLIFTFQVVIEFRLIELLPPAYTATARNAGDPTEPPATLTLMIHSSGYRLVTNKDIGTVDVSKRSDGTYDNAKLTEELARTQRALGLGKSLVLTADNDIEYKVVVAAMDAARAYQGQLLFPDVLLAQSSGGGG